MMEVGVCGDGGLQDSTTGRLREATMEAMEAMEAMEGGWRRGLIDCKIALLGSVGGR